MGHVGERISVKLFSIFPYNAFVSQVVIRISFDRKVIMKDLEMWGCGTVEY